MYQSLTELFTGICNAIRSKDGTTEPIQHQDIPDRIAAIKSTDSTGEPKRTKMHEEIPNVFFIGLVVRNINDSISVTNEESEG